MTVEGLLHYGKEESGEWYAFIDHTALHDFASSKVSQEDAFKKLAQILAARLNKVREAITAQ